MYNRPIKKVACPQCGQLAEFSPSNQYRPFCSERCKMIDLGAWASESYRIEAPLTPELPEDAEE